MERIKEAYNDQKTGFNSVAQLSRHLNESTYKVKKVLEENSESYARNKPYKNVSNMSQWKADRVGEIVHVDIMFYKATSTQIPIYIAVDVYSNYIWIIPLTTKSSDKGFKSMLRDLKKVSESPFKILTDGGREFHYMKEHPEIEHIISKSKHKAALAEANIARIRKFLRKLDGQEPVWKDIADNFNNVSFNSENSPHDIFFNGAEPPLVVPKLDTVVYTVGMFCRKREYKKSLHKQVVPWSKQIYVIVERIQYNGVYRYKIKPLTDDMKTLEGYTLFKKSPPDQGKYYFEELQLVDVSFLKKYI